MRLRIAALAACAAIPGGCGSEGNGSRADPRPPPSGSIEALWKLPGEDVGLLQGTADYAPGNIRVTFLVVARDGRVVSSPTARVWLARGMKAKPFLEGTAKLEPVGVGGAYAEDTPTDLYVAHLRVPRPGKYWLLAEPVGTRPIQALGNLVVKKRADSPAVGERAHPSRNPTLATSTGPISKLTTRVPPDRDLLRHSVADSLADRAPFVVAFATPALCASRTCGPVVDVVDTVRRSPEGRGIRFIHIEIYEDNDPAKGVNRWVREWSLPTEPWVFLVGRDGRIKAKFEGSVSVRELREAVREHLAA